MNEKAWYGSDEMKFPRLWLTVPEGHFLLRWEMIENVIASPDFLSIGFECEYGTIKIFASESLQELFEELQLELLRRIDGTKIKIQFIKRKL